MSGIDALKNAPAAHRPSVFDDVMVVELADRVSALRAKYHRITESDVRHEALDIVLERTRGMPRKQRAAMILRVRSASLSRKRVTPRAQPGRWQKMVRSDAYSHTAAARVRHQARR